MLALLPGAVPGKLVKVADWCAVEPAQPALPTLDEVLASMSDVLGLWRLQDKLQQIAEWEAWTQTCKCNAVGTSVGTECLTTRVYSNGNATVDRRYDLTARQATSGTVNFNGSKSASSPTGLSTYFWCMSFDAAGEQIGFNLVQTDALNSTVSGSYTLPAGTVHYRCFMTTNGTRDVDWSDATMCYTGPGFPAAPTSPAVPTPPALPTLPPIPNPVACSTDDLCKRLNDLQAQLLKTGNLVELIQRQAVPFAYIPGPVFSGLTGNGEVAVSGILAVSVDASDHPLTSVEFGHPNERFDNGWVNLGDADGWFERVPLGPKPTFIPSVPAFVTKVGYSLPPGVTATLRTWKREA